MDLGLQLSQILSMVLKDKSQSDVKRVCGQKQ